MNSNIYTAPVPRMPPGLIELMEGLTKDVLKNNPSDIFDFCSKHMEKLVKIRNGDGTKSGITLSQKITRAQDKVRQRSEIRQNKYDKEIKSLNVNREIQISCKREAVDNNEKPVLSLVSTDLPTEAYLDNPDEVIKTDVVNVEGKRQTEMENDEVDCQVDSIHNSQILIPLEITDLNSKSTLDELQDDVANKDNSEHSFECSENTKDQNEYLDNANITAMTENDNLSSVITNTIVIDADVNQTCFAVSLVEDENKSSSTNESLDTKLCKMSNENINYKPVLEHTNVPEETNEDQKSKDFLETNDFIKKNDIHISFYKDKDAITDGSLENSINNSEMFGTILNNYDAPKEKNSDNETQKFFNNEMDLEKAAITIQKVFRSFLFRSKTSSVDDATNVDINLLIENTNHEKHEIFENSTMSEDKRPLGLSRMDTVLQTVNEEKSLSVSTDDSSTLSSAATIIQAHVRGFLVRNKLNLNKTISTVSNIDSDMQSPKSLEKDINNYKNKTILNIHILPEGGDYLSRDESMMTSIDLPLDGSPPHTSNLHPLGYDKTERRKQLKREDAIQSISPPSNNSNKSEDIESVKEVFPRHTLATSPQVSHLVQSSESDVVIKNNQPSTSNDKESVINIKNDDDKTQSGISLKQKTELNNSAESNNDEMDVITPFATIEDDGLIDLNTSRLLHSGEFHDIIPPTMVTRNDTSVVREFQNVFVYFVLWNNP